MPARCHIPHCFRSVEVPTVSPNVPPAFSAAVPAILPLTLEITLDLLGPDRTRIEISLPRKARFRPPPACVIPEACIEPPVLLQAPNVLGRIEEGKKIAKKQMDIVIHGLWGVDAVSPLVPEVFTASGWPAVSTPVLRGLAGKPGAAKRALLELYGEELDTTPASSFDGARPCSPLCPPVSFGQQVIALCHTASVKLVVLEG